jgi:hypothetical protein
MNSYDRTADRYRLHGNFGVIFTQNTRENHAGAVDGRRRHARITALRSRE